MSIKDRLSRMVRKSNTSNTSTSTTSDSEGKKTPSVGRMLTKKFSRHSKPSTSSTSSDLHSSSDTSHYDNANPANANSARRPSPANLDGLRWEGMTDAQRVQATINAYEIRFGASNRARVSLEGISPCTTRTQQSGPEQVAYD